MLTKEWLEENYLIKKKSIKELIEESTYSKTEIFRSLKKFNIKREKIYLDSNWLYEKYIIQNLSANEIAKLADTSKPTILSALKKFNIAKNNEASDLSRKKNCLEKYGTERIFSSEYFIEKRKLSNLEKYGVEQPFQNQEIYEKYQKTMVERFGVTSALQNLDLAEKKQNTMFEKYGEISALKIPQFKNKMLTTKREKYSVDIFKENISNKIATRTINGLTLKEFSQDNEICYTTLSRFFRKLRESNKNVSMELIEQHIERLKNNLTNIEFQIVDQLKIPFYNKKEEKYRPDFKLSENSYLNADGLYWHSEFFRENDYHVNLRKTFESLNKRIFQFRENEILNFQSFEIVKSIIKSHLGQISKKVFARKCQIKLVNSVDAQEFLKNNHLDSYIKGDNIGLYFENELVYLITYRIRNKKLKLKRFCSKIDYRVMGGLSKLLNYLTKNNSIQIVSTLINLRFGTGESLLKLGFSSVRDIENTYNWSDGKNVYHSNYCHKNMDFRKLTEAAYASELKVYKIYDAGQRLYIKEF